MLYGNRFYNGLLFPKHSEKTSFGKFRQSFDWLYHFTYVLLECKSFYWQKLPKPSYWHTPHVKIIQWNDQTVKLPVALKIIVKFRERQSSVKTASASFQLRNWPSDSVENPVSNTVLSPSVPSVWYMRTDETASYSTICGELPAPVEAQLPAFDWYCHAS